MIDYEVGNQVTFAGGRGKISKIEQRPNGSHLLHVYTSEGELQKLPSGLPHIEKVDSIVDRLSAKQIDDPVTTTSESVRLNSTSRIDTTDFCR